MGLLVECPQCKKRCSPKADKCKCGFGLKKAGGKSYWIEYYVGSKRHRERIGPSKESAEQRLREVLSARTEGRYIERDKAIELTFGDLCKWYLGLPEVRQKRSFDRDEDSIDQLKKHFGKDTRIKDITIGRVGDYKSARLSEPSKVHKTRTVAPATVNREVACLKTIFARAVEHKKLNFNPIKGIKMLPEDNVRTRMLTPEEYQRLLNECAPHVKAVVITALLTGMRRDEIIKLVWSEVDLAKGFIRLPAERTKTGKARVIPIHPELKSMLLGIPRAIHTDRVFLYEGQPFDSVKTAFAAACRRAGIEDFRIHDLRHAALNNLRLAGNDYFRIMAISGHKTMSVFKRYNMVTEEELGQTKWMDFGDEGRRIDTNMDTAVG